jgi:hypothetical protein
VLSYTCPMAKRMVSARVDTELLDAVTARVKARGENITDVIERGFRAYLDPLDTRQLLPHAGPAQSAGGSACPHPKARVFKGLCYACGRAVP